MSYLAEEDENAQLSETFPNSGVTTLHAPHTILAHQTPMVTFLQGWISRCWGCKQLFSNDKEGYVHPHDLIFRLNAIRKQHKASVFPHE